MVTASLPRGYTPIVISNDCYPRQEGVGCKGWGHTEEAMACHVAGVLVEGLCKAVCSLAGCYHLLHCWRGEVHSSSQRERYSQVNIRRRQNKPAYLYRSIDNIASWRSPSEQLLAAMLRSVARPYYYSPREWKH